MSQAKVVDLRRERERRISVQLAPTLEHTSVVVVADALDSAEEWRAAARMAGRARGGASGLASRWMARGVWAVRGDLEPNEDDLRAAAGRLDDLLTEQSRLKPLKAVPSRRLSRVLFPLP